MNFQIFFLKYKNWVKSCIATTTINKNSILQNGFDIRIVITDLAKHSVAVYILCHIG